MSMHTEGIPCSDLGGVHVVNDPPARRVAGLPHLSAWMKDFYLLPGVADTVDFAGYRRWGSCIKEVSLWF